MWNWALWSTMVMWWVCSVSNVSPIKTSHSAPGASQQRHQPYCPHCHVLWLMTSQNQHPLMTSRWKILFPRTSALHTFQEGSYFKKVLEIKLYFQWILLTQSFVAILNTFAPKKSDFMHFPDNAWEWSWLTTLIKDQTTFIPHLDT